jgi:hypothetical protein
LVREFYLPRIEMYVFAIVLNILSSAQQGSCW